MQVPPKTFDSIVIRTVRWQQMKLDTLPLDATPLRKKCREIIDGVESLFLLHVGFGKDGPGGGGLVFLIWLVASVFAAGANIGVLNGFAQLLAQNSSVQGYFAAAIHRLSDDC